MMRNVHSLAYELVLHFRLLVIEVALAFLAQIVILGLLQVEVWKSWLGSLKRRQSSRHCLLSLSY